MRLFVVFSVPSLVVDGMTVTQPRQYAHTNAGYSILTAHSATELEFTFYRAFDNSVLDTFMITKD